MDNMIHKPWRLAAGVDAFFSQNAFIRVKEIINLVKSIFTVLLYP